MGKLDWQSPHFLLIEDLSEDWEPLPYAAIRLGSRDEAHAWVAALVRAGLLELVRGDVELNVGERSKVIESSGVMFQRGDILMRLSAACRDAYERRDMRAFERAIASYWPRT